VQVAELNPIIRDILAQFDRQFITQSQTQSGIHDVDACARAVFPTCGVCVSLLSDDAEAIMEAVSLPNSPRA
jgi:hypothetical protein